MARHTSESNSSSISSSFCLMEKQHCTAWYVSFLSLCNHRKCKAQIFFMSMIFQEDSRSKRRKKNKLYLIYLFWCFLLKLEIHCEDVWLRKGLGTSAVLSPPCQNHWNPHLHTGMAKDSWGWRAEQGCRESSSAMPVSCCLARRELRAACPLHDSERFQGIKSASSCRKSEDTKGDAFATSTLGRSCVLCYSGIVFDWVRNAQRKRASVVFEHAEISLERLTNFSKVIVSLEAALLLDHEFLCGSWTYLHNPHASSVVF